MYFRLWMVSLLYSTRLNRTQKPPPRHVGHSKCENNEHSINLAQSFFYRNIIFLTKKYIMQENQSNAFLLLKKGYIFLCFGNRFLFCNWNFHCVCERKWINIYRNGNGWHIYLILQAPGQFLLSRFSRARLFQPAFE